jgi:O-antigen biosynthesis protein
VRVALVSYNARSGDAIGNQIAEKLSFFLDGGADVRVFVESDQGLHPQVRPHCRLLAPEPRGEGWKFLRKCDLVVVDYSQAYSLLGLLPLLAAERPRVILDYHGVTPPEFWGGSNTEALADGQRWRGLVGFADAALVHSRSSHRELLTPTRFPTERTTSLGYPIDTSFWEPGPTTRDLRERLGIDADARLLLFVGRLAKNKRVPLLAELLHRLGEQDPPIHAVVIGDDSDVYELEATACRARAAELDVADRLHILGRVPFRDLRDAYRSADVFVMPSRHEGFCIPAIEAMACGVPVVAARSAALPETVADAGLTFIPDDVDDFARQVGRWPLTPDPSPPKRGRGEKCAPWRSLRRATARNSPAAPNARCAPSPRRCRRPALRWKSSPPALAAKGAGPMMCPKGPAWSAACRCIDSSLSRLAPTE